MEATKVVTLEEKLKELEALAKTKKNILELQEVESFLKDMELSPEMMEKVYDYLEQKEIDVLQTGNTLEEVEEDDDIDIDLSEEEEIDLEKIDLSVPEGISTEDPVRMYLSDGRFVGIYYLNEHQFKLKKMFLETT